MNTPIYIACIAAVAGIVLLCVMFFQSFKSLFRLIFTSVFGWAGLYIFNRIFSFCAFSIGINLASATIAGVLGLPGVALMALVKLIYQI